MDALRRAGLAAALALAFFATGCSEKSYPATDGCNVRVELEGAIYRPHNELNPAAPVGKKLAQANLLACDGMVINQAQAFRVKGVDPRTALIVKDERAAGVYVAEALEPQDWPEALR